MKKVIKTKIKKRHITSGIKSYDQQPCINQGANPPIYYNGYLTYNEAKRVILDNLKNEFKK